MGKIIEDFLEKGLIDKEAAARLELFENSLSKEANWADMAKNIGMGILKGVVPATAGAILGEMAYEHFGKGKLEEDKKIQHAGMVNSFENMMLSNPHLETRRPEVYERFMEIGSLSPTVASAPSVAKKVIERTLDSGLDEKDMSNLLNLENNSRALRQQGVPSTFMGMASKGFLTSLGQGLSVELSAPPVVAPGVSAVASGASDEVNTDEWSNSQKLKRIALTYKILHKKNADFPSEIRDLNVDSPQGLLTLGRYLEKNPGILGSLTKKTFSSQQEMDQAFLNEIQGMQKKAEILGIQYCLIKNANLDSLDKTAAPIIPIGKMGPVGKTLLGLGAASLFGFGVAAAEEAADYARTRKMNTILGESLDKTKKNLSQMSEEGHRLSSGIDYTDRKVMDKAVEQFRVLSDIAPALAANPTVATSFVNTVMSQEGVISPELIKMISDTQKNLSSIREYKSPFASSPFTSGISRGFGAAGGEEMIRSVAKGLTE